MSESPKEASYAGAEKSDEGMALKSERERSHSQKPVSIKDLKIILLREEGVLQFDFSPGIC
jgi:hypothetical protein